MEMMYHMATNRPQDLWLKSDGKEAVTHGGEDKCDKGHPYPSDHEHLPDLYFFLDSWLRIAIWKEKIS